MTHTTAGGLTNASHLVLPPYEHSWQQNCTTSKCHPVEATLTEARTHY